MSESAGCFRQSRRRALVDLERGEYPEDRLASDLYGLVIRVAHEIRLSGKQPDWRSLTLGVGHLGDPDAVTVSLHLDAKE